MIFSSTSSTITAPITILQRLRQRLSVPLRALSIASLCLCLCLASLPSCQAIADFPNAAALDSTLRNMRDLLQFELGGDGKNDDKNWLHYRGPSGNGNTPHGLSPPLAIRWKIPLQASLPSGAGNGRGTRDGGRDDYDWNGSNNNGGGSSPNNGGDSIVEPDWIPNPPNPNAPANPNAPNPSQSESVDGRGSGGGVRAFNPPLVEDKIIYFGSTDKNFYALDLRSGYMRWIFPTKNEVNSVPYIQGDRIYFGSNDGRLYALDKATGQEVWSFQSGQTIQSLISGWRDLIIFTSDQGSTFFLQQESGQVLHSIPNRAWSHHTFQIYEGIIYWTPFDGGFGAYDIEQRKFLWSIRVPTDKAVWYSYPAVTQDRVYFASSFFNPGGGAGSGSIRLVYYALDRHNGTVLWQQEADFNFPSDVTPNVYNGFFRHIELLDYLAPALWQDLVIYTSGDRVVRAFRQEDGDLVWQERLPALTSSAPTIGRDRIYFGTHARGGGRGAFGRGDGRGLRGDGGGFGFGGAFGRGLRGDGRSVDGDGGGDGSGPSAAADQSKRAPQLMCLSARNGKVLWQTPMEGAVLAAPVLADDALYLGTDQHMFYVLEEVF